ncbi:styrene monooxygenase/indole monooxygenase family protein [Actinoallomurus sp. NPDC052274]|uniref:styrene monooxygenase/indole monooxygenase family protein n=1 Tax=Actinoallomurus sp. NPDC052274 TaxID=3155420 RepID=UPI003428C32D
MGEHAERVDRSIGAKRKILIVGAGQAGLQLALSLPADRYDVTVMTARTAEEIRDGRVMSTQMMFGPALDRERENGLNLWESQAPAVAAFNVTVAGPPGAEPLRFTAALDAHAQSVDQRVKMSAWLERFRARGGEVIVHHATAAELPALTERYDLTIVAAGRGDLVELFDRDPDRSPYDRPQRALSVIYVHGMAPRGGFSAEHVGITVLPGVGELFTMPALTPSGRCDIIFFEAVPGGPLDRWDTLLDPPRHLALALDLMRRYAPAEYERCRDVRPTDERCNLVGAYTPTVRRPVGEPGGGTPVLGMGDVVVANDPIAGQGANNAAHCAAVYARAILDHGDRPFDREWMRRTFEAYWGHARHSTAFSNLLLGPLPQHVQQVLGTAAGDPAVARRFVNGYADPGDFNGWLTGPDGGSTHPGALTDTADRQRVP